LNSLREFRLQFKEKVFAVKREEKGWTIRINTQSVFLPEDKLPETLALLDGAFFGILKDNTSIQAESGYIVLLRGQDKWAIRIGKADEREVVYLTRLDIRSLYYFFLLS
jgi:hypothetical protein